MAAQENQESTTEKFELPSDGRMVLRTENLVKKYGKRTVVSHVSINVKQGEIVGLLGPNGAGKTTSFDMTTGLIVANEGHIYLNEGVRTSGQCASAGRTQQLLRVAERCGWKGIEARGGVRQVHGDGCHGGERFE